MCHVHMSMEVVCVLEVVCVFFVYMHSTILLPEHPLVALHVSSMIFANEIT